MTTKKLLSILLSFPATVVIYIILHESGHSLVALIAGSSITEFSILHAHVSYSGGRYSDFMIMLREAGGSLLPLFVSLICMIMYREKINGTIIHMLYILICFMPAGSLWVWVIIPVLYVRDIAPAGDDVTKFLDVFSWYAHPAFVSIAALTLFFGCMILTVSKGIFQSSLSLFRDPEERSAMPGQMNV